VKPNEALTAIDLGKSPIGYIRGLNRAETLSPIDQSAATVSRARITSSTYFLNASTSVK
jgi:hypothetical protein